MNSCWRDVLSSGAMRLWNFESSSLTLPLRRVQLTAFQRLVITFLLFGCISLTSGHIVLTYPSARKYALDFLDNQNNGGPCGMPRGLSEDVTLLLSGATINVTWHSAYPHQGGYKLELLDANYERISTLFPNVGGREPRTSQFETRNLTNNLLTVTLPKNVRCSNCTLRLTRQAEVFSDEAPDSEGFLLRSCADVNIVDEVPSVSRCTGRGILTGNRCSCDDLYTGDVCQYQDVCFRDNDCSFHGKCIDTDSVSYPKKRCFCHAGWYNHNCSRESAVKTRAFNKARYTHRRLADGFDLYWKLTKDSTEIDMVVQSQSTSWIAIGWRPTSISPQCKTSFPSLPEELFVPHGASAIKKEEFDGIRPRSLDGPEPDEHLGMLNTSEFLSNWNSPDSNISHHNYSSNSSLFHHELHPMDCTDVIIGYARGNVGQVQDAYSRDRSTPQEDSFYGFKNSLLGAVAYEEHGITTMRFRRPIAATEPTDHSISRGPMHVIFARGLSGSRLNSTDMASGPEFNLTAFYKPDVLLYHGSNKSDRGVTVINFFEENNEEAKLKMPCAGEFRSPNNCVGSACRYIARWEYLEHLDSVYFQIESSVIDRWTGIGFGERPDKMPNADIIIGWVDDEGKVKVVDRFADGYRVPREDKKQYLQNIAGSIDGGLMKIEFTRPRLTNDTDNFQFFDGNCAYFLLPIDGGKFDKISGTISKHAFVPLTSKEKICIQKCGLNITGSRLSVTAEEHVRAPMERSDETSSSSSTSPALNLTSPIPDATTTSGSSLSVSDTSSTQSVPRHTLERIEIIPHRQQQIMPSPPPFMLEPNASTTTEIPTTVTPGHSRESAPSFRTVTFVPTTTSTTVVPPIRVLDTPATQSTTMKTSTSMQAPSSKPSTASTGGTPITTPLTQLSNLRFGSADDSTTTDVPEHRTPNIMTPEPVTAAPMTGDGQNTNCQGKWYYPKNCSAENCEYIVMWEYLSISDEISFYISSAFPDRWTGIGFSPFGMMTNSDIIIAYALWTGEIIVTDASAGGHMLPSPDPVKGIHDEVGWVKNGRLHVAFKRKRNTNSTLNAVFGDSDVPTVETCPFFLYPFHGGLVDLFAGTPMMHATTPAVSKERICIRTCLPGEQLIPAFMPSTPRPTTTTPRTTVSTTSTTTTPSTTTAMPVIEGTRCDARFSYPRYCEGSSCVYVAAWEYLAETDEIKFIIQSNRINAWTGIGFSETGTMTDTDIIVGWVNEEGRPTISDRWANDYGEPSRDLSQDLTHLGGVRQSGVQSFTFRRKRATQDPRDFQFSDTTCPYMIFPVHGGKYDESDESIDKHEFVPVTSSVRICVRACRLRPTAASPLAENASRWLNDQKLVIVDANLLIAWNATTPSPRFRSGSDSRISGNVTRARPRTIDPNFRPPTLKRHVHVGPEPTVTTRKRRATWLTGATRRVTRPVTTQSPEEMLKALLAQAGMGNISLSGIAIEVPGASMEQAVLVTTDLPSTEDTATEALTSNGASSVPTREANTGLTIVTKNAETSTAGSSPTSKSPVEATIAASSASQPVTVDITEARKSTTSELKSTAAQEPESTTASRTIVAVAPSTSTSTEVLPSTEVTRSEQRPAAAERSFGEEGPQRSPKHQNERSTLPPISMSPEEMLAALLRSSGMSSAVVESSQTETPVDGAPVTQKVESPLPLVLPRPMGVRTRKRPVVTEPDFDMSSSMMVSSVAVDPTALPQSLPITIVRESDGERNTQSAPRIPQPAAPTVLGPADQGTLEEIDGCRVRFKYPSGCDGERCSYIATWRRGSNLDEIEFSLETNQPDLWTAIGFSDDPLMKNSDMIYGYIRPNGQPRLTDAHATDYVPPSRDFRNDVRTIDGGRTGSRAFYRFARKLTTDDPNDYDFGAGKCPFFKFAVVGGTFDPNTAMISKHQQTPIVSARRLCLRHCSAPTSPAPIPLFRTVATSETPERVMATTVETMLTTTSATVSATDLPTNSMLRCNGEFRFPDDCGEGKQCDYIAQWEYLGATDEIRFIISNAKPTEWTGIGFNDKRAMSQADIVYGWLDDETERAVVIDASASGYFTPVRDLQQDVRNLMGKRTETHSMISFTRKRITRNDKDYHFTETTCPYFIFPVRGGNFDGQAMMISKHKSTPMVSTQRICITSACNVSTALPRPTTVPTTTAVDIQQTSDPVPSATAAPSAPEQSSTREPDTTTPASFKPTSYSPCEGMWKYPEECVEPNCIYVASWAFMDDADAIRFVVKAKAAGWTGIGFNDDMMMRNADAIIGWVTSKNTVVVTDRHCDGNVGAPMDDEQHVYDISGRREDGYQIIEFSRKRDSQDPNGHSYVFGDQKCPFFIFPVVGGSYDSYGGIQAHSLGAKPKISSERICVRSCNTDVPRRMVVSFRIIGRSWIADLELRQSPIFKKLESDLAEALRRLLGNTPGFRGTRVVAFRQGSIIADVEIVIDPTANQTSIAGAKVMKIILTDQVQQKRVIGPFTIDPKSLAISNAEQIVAPSGPQYTPMQMSTGAPTSADKSQDSVRTYAIIAGVCGIIAILLFLAFGKVWHDRKQRLARRQQRLAKSVSSGATPRLPLPDPVFSRASRSSSLEATRHSTDTFGTSKPIYDIAPSTMMNGKAASIASNSNAGSLPPDYSDSGNNSRKTRRTAPVMDSHPLHRLSMDESDRTLTTYSSNNSTKEKRNSAHGSADIHDWSHVDDTEARPPDFYFMPSQRRWTRVPRGF